MFFYFFFQAEDGIRDYKVTGVQTCALPISRPRDESDAAAERVAVGADDHRGRAMVDRLEHLPEAARVLDVLLVAELDRGAHPLDVCPGAEALALAGEHDRAR